jgi:hypothetical protein
MDWLVRARALVAEAESLDLTIEDLVAAARTRPRSPSGAPTVAEYIGVVERALGDGRTAETYRSYWRLAVARFGDRPIDEIGDDDCTEVVADAVIRAQQRRPGSDGRSSHGGGGGPRWGRPSHPWYSAWYSSADWSISSGVG